MTWIGAELAGSTEWIVELAEAEVAELRAAADTLEGRTRGEVTRADVPLDTLAPRIAEWRAELDRGRGFLLVRGVPVDDGDDAAAAMLWALGVHLGRPIRQNPAGDVLGHVVDTGVQRDDPMVRKYQTTDDIAFHVDLGDVVGLLCLRPGRRGGASRIVSSLAIYDEILGRRPDLVPLLSEPFPLDRRNEESPGEPPFVMLPICTTFGGRMRIFYHSDYFRSVERLPAAPRLTDAQREVLDVVEEIGADPAFHLDMDFRPGDVQLLNNHTVLHARTAYEDDPDPAHRRHLLRLWLVFA